MIGRILLCAGILSLSAAAQAATGDYPINAPIDGPKSIYSEPLLKVLREWPPKDLAMLEKTPGDVKVQCYETPDNDTYIGVEQFMTVDAPVSKVEAVLDDFASYSKLFDGVIKVEVKQKDRNRILTFWESNVPIPFVPNVKSEMTYVVDKSRPDRKVYRYSLKKSNNLKVDDGIIVIEADGKNRTRYTEFDFYDADWGLAKSLGSNKIWKDSVVGLIQSDLAIKLRAEHSDWSYEQVMEKSKKLADEAPVKERIHSKARFYLLPAPSPTP